MHEGPPLAPVRRVKPRLRGVSHQWASVVAPFGWAWLVFMAQTSRAATAAFVYGGSLAILFVVSAVYHRPMWTPAARRLLRRLDHASIFILIAGTYTPICMLVLDEGKGTALLWTVWIAAAAGIAKSVLWVHAPRVVTAAVYVAFGWAALPLMPIARAEIGASGLALLAAGGLIYSAGAVVYAFKRPDPAPTVFGYHEIFHAMVIAAALCHFAAIFEVVHAST